MASKQHEHGSWWTSYADLFMMLSIVFLLMYVASSLRSGSAGYQQQAEFKKLAQKASDLEEQIKVYNTLKDESLKKQATSDEQQVYQKLMDHLNLLQDTAHNEKLALEKKAKENAEKEFALNQYQQLIRNIINSNVLAKTQIHHRDEIIVAKNATIEEKREKIAQMELVIGQNKRQINQINAQLDQQIAALEQEKSNHKITQAVMVKKIAMLRKTSESQVKALEENNRGISEKLSEVKTALVETKQELGQTVQVLSQTKQVLGQKEAELGQTKNALGQTVQVLSQTKQVLGQKEAELGKTVQVLGQTKNALGQKEAELGQTKNALGQTAAELGKTKNALGQTEQKLASTEKGVERALAEVGSLKDDLAKTKAIANARKQLAAQIAGEFAKSGIKGAVDGRTGEVTLDFGDEYFDRGSTVLKPKMTMTLDKFIPAYSQSLFKDPKVADKISSVEIIGFASSTYKGRYVNPRSVKEGDKEAIEYNLKLSFGRANSIFSHVLNQNKLSREDREKLLSLMKVVGRGYLPEGATDKELGDGMTEAQFCAKFNCNKAQKVVVKFNMKD